MNPALRQLPLSTANLKITLDFSIDLGDLIEGLRSSVPEGSWSLVAPTCQSVDGFFSDTVEEGEILGVFYCTEISFICHSFGVSKHCKMILVA